MLSHDFIHSQILGDFAAIEISDSALLKKMKIDSSPWMASTSARNFCIVSDLINKEAHPYYESENSKI
jgi:hypothetical protein